MSSRAAALVLILAVGLVRSASAEEVVLGMIGSVRWDTDAYQDSGRRVNAWRGGIGPRVRLRRLDPAFNYSARYQAQYERSLDQQARDTWEHLGQLSGTWNISPRTRLDFRDNFISQERPVFFASTADPGDLPGAEDVDDELQRTTRNVAVATLTHRLDRRWALVSSFSHSLVEVSTDRRSDSVSLSGQLYTSYVWSARTELDLGSSLTYTSIDGTTTTTGSSQAGSRTRSIQVFAGWNHQPLPSVNISLRGGPTFFRTKSKRTDTSGLNAPRYVVPGVPTGGAAYAYDSCLAPEGTPLFSGFGGGVAVPFCAPVVVSGVNGQPLSEIGVSDDEITSISGSGVDEDAISFFGEASISKTWRNVTARLAYRRTQTPSTQSGGTTGVDRVTGSVIYEPPGPWQFRFVGDWSLRQSLSDVELTRPRSFDFLNQDVFPVTAEDSGLRGLDSFGNERAIAQAGSLVTDSVSNAVETYTWSILLRAQRRLENNGSVAFDLRYRRINEKGDLAGTGNRGRFLATIRFEYDLDPFEL